MTLDNSSNELEETLRKLATFAPKTGEERFREDLEDNSSPILRLGHLGMRGVERLLQVHIPRKVAVIGAVSVAAIATVSIYNSLDSQPQSPPLNTEKHLDPICYERAISAIAPEDLTVAVKMESAASCMQTTFGQLLTSIPETSDR